MSSGRVAVMRESSWRSEPAAALRGLANGGSPALGALRVELLERGAWEDDLAAHLEPRAGSSGVPRRVAQAQRNAADRLHVGGDVLAVDAVAARRGACTSSPSS